MSDCTWMLLLISIFSLLIDHWTRATEITTLDGHKLQWKDTQVNEGPEIQFDGIPYINVGWMVKECQNGPDRQKKKKAKYKEEKNKDKKDHGYTKKTRRHIQDSKKLDCPAKIRLRIIVKFPQYKVDDYNDTWNRKQMSIKLRENLRDSCVTVERQIQYHLLLPERNDHQNHLLDELAGFCQPVDSKIILKIKQLVIEEGVRSVHEMKRHIRMFVTRDLYPGQQINPFNRRYYPHDRDIKNHIDKALACTRYSKNDQENFEFIVEEWRKEFPDDKFFLRTSYQQEKENNTDFLFVHQTSWQKRLMSLYGNDIAIMDATYKTSNYSLPLFFICVQTNVGHSIVASFITASESQSAIREALEIIKNWNVEWHPKFFMTDYDNREIDAVEGLFEGCSVYLCSFHREQAWKRWTRDTKHGVGINQEEMLALFRQIAQATSEDHCEAAIEKLKSHNHWKDNAKMRNWFQHSWLSEKKRWVRGFREDSYNIRVTTTNGLERKHRDLKQKYLVNFSEGSISSLATTLINEFLSDSYKMYKSYNVQSLDLCKKYHAQVPEFLCNKPKMFIEHCLQRMPPNVNDIPDSNFSRENGILQVKSVDSNNTYILEIGAEPKCSCSDWMKLHLPCKHLLAMFLKVQGCSWNDMSEKYTSCPHFNIDPFLKEQAMASVPKPTSQNNAAALECLAECSLDNNIDPAEKEEIEELVNNETSCRPITSSNNLKKSLAVLKDIENGIFLIKDNQHLLDIFTQLQAIKVYIDDKVPIEAGLPTLTTNKTTRKRTKKYINLPQRKKFKVMKKTQERQQNIPQNEVIEEGTFDIPIQVSSEEELTKNLELPVSLSLTDSERGDMQIVAKPKRKIRKTYDQEQTTVLVSTDNKHWLFQGTNAKTAITQTLVSGMCGFMDEEISSLQKGEAIIGNEPVAGMFETYVKPWLEQVIEIKNGSTEYYSPHWRQIRFVNGIPLDHHLEMRNNHEGLERRQEIFVNNSEKELNALILEAFGIFKLKTKLRVGYPHGYYLTVKQTQNEKLLQNLEDVMGQNMNIGWNYFMDVLMVEAKLMICSKIKTISITEADKWLYPF